MTTEPELLDLRRQLRGMSELSARPIAVRLIDEQLAAIRAGNPPVKAPKAKRTAAPVGKSEAWQNPEIHDPGRVEK